MTNLHDSAQRHADGGKRVFGKLLLTMLATCAVISLAPASAEIAAPTSELFTPYPVDQYVSTNGISFSRDGTTVYMALRRTDEQHFGIYTAHNKNGAWSAPQLLPFSKQAFNPYEPTISPDGSFLVFNSRHPLQGANGVAPAGPRLWVSEKTGDGWGAPAPLKNIASEKFASSYATFTDNGDLYFFSSSTPIPSRPSGVKEDAGQPLSEAIHFSKKTSNGFEPPVFVEGLLPISKPGEKISVGDPWVAPDGAYMIYTLYDDAVGWRETVDLVISFATDHGWSAPVKLDAINSDGVDNSPSASHHGTWFYFRSKGQLRRIKLQALLKSVER